jgi:hypothetical protein
VAAGLAQAPYLGDIILARETVISEAEAAGKPFEDHFTHLVVHGEHKADGILRDAQVVLHERFGIHHVTLQLEAEACAEHCASEPAPH